MDGCASRSRRPFVAPGCGHDHAEDGSHLRAVGRLPLVLAVTLRPHHARVQAPVRALSCAQAGPDGGGSRPACAADCGGGCRRRPSRGRLAATDRFCALPQLAVWGRRVLEPADPHLFTPPFADSQDIFLTPSSPRSGESSGNLPVNGGKLGCQDASPRQSAHRQTVSSRPEDRACTWQRRYGCAAR